ncbi:MAG: hypothetical protein WC325_12255 [Candidatus Bathyarchaeia archaeon]|jgi:predicted  nucleic acid-binding Zn-ribbon protein
MNHKKLRLTGQMPSNASKQRTPPQGISRSVSPRQQNPVARRKNDNATQNNAYTQLNNTIQTMSKNINALQKENTALKAKLIQAQRNKKSQ